jgi:sensor histidine kinase regulating citrate/malate metabolism
MLSKPTFSIHKKNRRILIVYVVAFLILVSLSGSKIIFSYYSTIKTAQVSIANQSIEMAKSIADSLDKQTYKRFLANPIRNEEYWRIREYLNDARNQIGALYVYTLAIDNPKIAKGMIIGLPRDYPNEDDFPIGEPCTVPEKEVQLAYQGKTYFTEILTDPNYGNYLSVGAPIKEDNGNIIGYIGIDISTKMLNDIGNKVIKDSITTFIFDLVFILVLLIAFFLIQKWYQKEIKKVFGETEQTF